jgi:hypothetical protein
MIGTRMNFKSFDLRRKERIRINCTNCGNLVKLRKPFVVVPGGISRIDFILL